MNRRAGIPQHLASLRRYARALTGTQKAGDTLVVVTMNAIARNATTSQGSSEEVSLFRTLTEFFNGPIGAYITSLHANDHVHSASFTRLARMTPLSRQAYLLVAMEEFTASQATEIIGLDAVGFAHALETAEREVAQQVTTDVLIIEDEFFISADLEDLLTDMGHRVVATARTREEAVTAFARHRPGLILADIQLADGTSGIDAANDILHVKQIPIIFVTSHPDRLLTGLRPEPTFLIRKPFQSELVKAVSSQALFFDRKASAGAMQAELASGRVHAMAARGA